MKLSAGIAIIFVCFVQLTAWAQTSTIPKKTAASTKADSSQKSHNIFSEEFGFFGKFDTSIIKIDTSNSVNLNKYLDEFLQDDKKKSTVQSGVQQDKTLGWLTQNGNTDVWVTSASPLSNTDHYNGFIIAPRQAKTLHLDITGTLFLSNSYTPHYVPFYLQVKNSKGIFVNELEQGKKTLNISLSTADSVAVYFIAHPNEKDTVDFHCVWSIGDTADYSYAGQQPEVVFDKMLELAPNQFTNLRADKFGLAYKIDYPQGLFASLPAERIPFDTHVTQYTGKNLATGKAADNINAEWNKKITGWLKDYAITDIKKTETGDRQKNSDTEITTYTKKNAEGKILFIVKVFKEQEGEGSEFEPVTWNTGVSIY